MARFNDVSWMSDTTQPFPQNGIIHERKEGLLPSMFCVVEKLGLQAVIRSINEVERARH